MRRRFLGLLGFATGVAVGTVLYRRSGRARRERVDLYFDDGSMVSLGDGTPGAERLLPVARQALSAARR
ncbi:MAG: hypothetical protein E6G08_13170 [Actinobacteria bacterium]|nr:MAG: hypothetical protein E6G08_13170 [Actinomycetota bacterium]